MSIFSDGEHGAAAPERASDSSGSAMLEVCTEMMLRGERTTATWTSSGIRAHPDVLARLDRTDIALDDPATFLVAVRAAFGDEIDVHVRTPN